jgi:hypothetical protein
LQKYFKNCLPLGVIVHKNTYRVLKGDKKVQKVIKNLNIWGIIFEIIGKILISRSPTEIKSFERLVKCIKIIIFLKWEKVGIKN